ncbi:MAG: hypothetical protein WD872_05935 [Pirellulaceae bacterium]
MEECLVYFRQAIANPSSVPRWSVWWKANEELAQNVFSLADYVRLKHRRLLGAQQILQRAGELPKDHTPASPLVTGWCGQCGEPAIAQPAVATIACPICGTTWATDGGTNSDTDTNPTR